MASKSILVLKIGYMSFIIHYLKSFHFENKVYTEASYTRAMILNYDHRALEVEYLAFIWNVIVIIS